ncbi:Bro-N domain-containing protein [Xylella fastidiosa subsp. multiplex]|uniref:Bro-N domain-containing protein n=2 Tax=Xylella fastidiosa TaxID=2371 RepID=A0AAW6HRG1_XYLFS|nr:Bro-N domain-containing protein [Xylella fastidiosa subsp. multiplex]
MNGPFYPRCGPSLTHIHRCGTVAGKESESSVASGTRIRNTRGFFVPVRFYVGRAAAIQDPVRGKAAHRLATAFYLPAPLRAASESVTARLKPQLGDVLMHAPIPFSFDNQSVRVFVLDGQPWFAAKDLCSVLRIKNSRKAITVLDASEKGVTSSYTLGGQQELAIVNESGMWTLVLRCRDAVKPGTVPYRVRKWITGEVLPSIRKTGEYTVNPDLEYDQMRSYSKDRKQMEALNTAHSRWISDVRRALESAGIKEPEFPKELEDSKAIATSALVELLRWHRWILDFGPDFRLRLTPVTLHTNFLTSDEVADWVRHPTFPSKHLPDIAKVAIERMSKAFSEKAIGPHLEQVAPKVMGNASRHLS